MFFIQHNSLNTMTSPKIVFSLTCLLLGVMGQITEPKLSSPLHQERSLVSANVGDRITLQCFHEGDAARLYWYKQCLGQKPVLISTFYRFERNATFYNEFKNNPRFTLDIENSKHHLKLLDVRVSDSATYYCASSYVFILEFAEGTTVSVQGSGLNVKASVHQSSSETIQPGGSVTLNCTVHIGNCDGEHSVYWFKDSEDSHPGIIYTGGGRNDQCKRNPYKPTHTCVYNLPMENISLSQNGIYYCAIASCGHVVFGNGTKLDFEVEQDRPIVVYILSGALTFTTVFSVLSSFLMYKMNKRNGSAEPEAGYSVNSEDCQEKDDLHYAALRVNQPNRSRRQTSSTRNECVYSSVKQ